MRPTPVRLLLLCAALSVAAPVRASTVAGATVEDLARAAGAIVEGQVTHTRAVTVDDGRRILTVVTVSVARSLKGGAFTQVQVVVPGGHVGNIAQQVTGLPALTVGEQVVLFLARRPGAAHPVPRFDLTALGLSIYQVQGTRAVRHTRGLEVVTGPLDRAPKQVASDDRLDLATLRARIRAALKSPGRAP